MHITHGINSSGHFIPALSIGWGEEKPELLILLLCPHQNTAGPWSQYLPSLTCPILTCPAGAKSTAGKAKLRLRNKAAFHSSSLARGTREYSCPRAPKRLLALIPGTGRVVGVFPFLLFVALYFFFPSYFMV